MPADLERLERDLAEAIRVELTAHPFDEEICAAALAYSDFQYGLPPAVFACPTSLRAGLLEQRDSPWFLWQAAEWMSLARRREVTLPEIGHEYGHPELRARCAALEHEIEEGETDPLAQSAILRPVARRLNTEPLPPRLPRSKDFVIYAWEVTGGTLEEDLAWSLPPERLELFMSRGWL